MAWERCRRRVADKALEGSLAISWWNPVSDGCVKNQISRHCWSFTGSHRSPTPQRSPPDWAGVERLFWILGG
ncbi:hypothetical protein C1H46_014418 [Malus baccata]|uniref:Uncharacterized protein n=1 Tax=Malus baccata TaxID=106549 RepID=A0A540MMD0_MALBA|nr:hypothetical protein C1H46_014418 [Malus baccata]